MMAKAATETTDKTYRIWVDGCFDFFHHGHANILRQAKQLFPSVYLIVGVHSDASILLNKGPSIMKQDERYQQVRACKWTDEVVEDAPYFTSLEMVKKWNVDFVVHGDDITTLADGTDCYQAVKDAGMYMECKRTVGVSTTEIVGRMLLMSKDHLKFKNPFQISNPSPSTPSTYYSLSSLPLNFLTYPTPTIKPTDRVYYVDGGFDLFHYAHVKFLAKLKEECDFLIVGIHDDECVNAIKGKNYPIMTLYERGLCVLACRYVDDVILGAPYTPSISALSSKYSHITHIVHGSTVIDQDVDDRSPYDEAKELFKIVESAEPDVTTETIINRILENRTLYEERNRKKNTAKKELKN